MAEEVDKLLRERLQKFEALIGQSECRHIPHIVMVFDDEIKAANVGATPQFRHPLTQILALLDVARHQCATLAQEQLVAQDTALLQLLKSVGGPTRIN